MIALFYATRIIDGKTTYKKVPIQLRPEVDDWLIDKGYPELIGGD